VHRRRDWFNIAATHAQVRQAVSQLHQEEETMKHVLRNRLATIAAASLVGGCATLKF